MGTVVHLDAHRRQREARHHPSRAARSAELFFDLADPASYLAAERAERVLGHVTWVPAVHLGARADLHPGVVHARVQARAAELGLPLVAPEGMLAPRGAMRVAVSAAELGRGAEFALAAFRLAFCGGLDLADPDVLAEAVAAAGLDHELAAEAASDASLDELVTGCGRFLAEHGVTATPAVRVGGVLLAGEERLEEAGRLSHGTPPAGLGTGRSS